MSGTDQTSIVTYVEVGGTDQTRILTEVGVGGTEIEVGRSDQTI